MAQRKWHWFENGIAICGRKTAGYSACQKDLVTCRSCNTILLSAAKHDYKVDATLLTIDYEELMRDTVYIELLNQH